jgi:hypothetical protein
MRSEPWDGAGRQLQADRPEVKSGLRLSAPCVGAAAAAALAVVLLSIYALDDSTGGAALTPGPLVAAGEQARGGSLFVEPEALRGWMAAADAPVLLDAREGAVARISGAACAAPWKSLAQWGGSGGNRSTLRPAPELERTLRGCGVRGDRAVVVYGDWDQAWGEEGRLFWTLEYLGHSRCAVLRGGFA